jgi:hypothetical protein
MDVLDAEYISRFDRCLVGAGEERNKLRIFVG